MAESEVTRSDFIETLNEACLSYKGYGIYAFFNPVEILNLFNKFLKQKKTVREFAWSLARSL